MPEFPAEQLNQAMALQNRGDHAAAQSIYWQILLDQPTQFDALHLLGVSKCQQGQQIEGSWFLARALDQRPDVAPVLFNLGRALAELHRYGEAIARFDQALVLRPNHAATWFNRGDALQTLGRHAEAIESYQRALELAPGMPGALANLGTAMLAAGQSARAIETFRAALDSGAKRSTVLAGIGRAQLQLGQAEAARASFAAACDAAPDAAEPRWLWVTAALPDIAMSEAEIAASRPAFAAALAAVDAWYAADTDFRRDRLKLDWPFFLAYQAQANRALMACFGGLRARLLDEWRRRQSFVLVAATEPGAAVGAGLAAKGSVAPKGGAASDAGAAPDAGVGQEAGAAADAGVAPEVGTATEAGVAPKAGAAIDTGPVRVGIVSAQLYRHSVWQAITRGWFAHFDPGRIALHAFHVGVKSDAETAFARSHAAGFTVGNRPLADWVSTIQAARPEVLIYPEIGMDNTTANLASLRLAPVQLASWGHPETTGLPTIDGYISAEAFEPAGAQACYTETLIRLPRLGVSFVPQSTVPRPPDLAALGIDPSRPIVLCPGAPFKYAPANDAVLTEIARRAGNAQLIFFHARNKSDRSLRLAQRLAARFAAEDLAFDAHVSFLPFQEMEAFQGLLQRADLCLDTIGFSGFNTAMQVLSHGTPLVAYEGAFMRGRFASGILRMLGLVELVAADTAGFVAIATRLAMDTAWRDAMRARIAEDMPALYDDCGAVQALQDTIERLVLRYRRAASAKGQTA
jgi:predicted O-linked N-acetylglucosamine transferase (SPINDLY family)